jgi:uncharacterized membrane protein
MRAHLRYLWYRLTASLWLVPAAMILGAVVLAFAMLTLGRVVPWAWAEKLGWLLPVGAAGSRQVLATIAGSMITVASLVFSMTLVTLTLAASQLGPRLIARFMRDRINQVVLGTFLATFVYALLILQTVTDAGDEAAVPHLAVLVALLLTLASLGWLIFFIHHVAESIQADSVIALVSEELSRAIRRRFPEIGPARPLPLETPFLDRLAAPAGVVAGRASGYVQAIDARALLRSATRDGLLIQIEARPGDFVVAGAPLLLVWPRERLSEELARTLAEPVVIGPKRTSAQDIDFAISALVEIALRALSPGINDPRTAIGCIDRLTQALVEISQLAEPPTLVPDDDGALRLIIKPARFAEVIAAAFDPIREAGRNHAWILGRLAEVLAVLASFARSAGQHATLARQAAVLESVCRAAPLDDAGRERVGQSLEALRRALAEAHAKT